MRKIIPNNSYNFAGSYVISYLPLFWCIHAEHFFPGILFILILSIANIRCIPIHKHNASESSKPNHPRLW